MRFREIGRQLAQFEPDPAGAVPEQHAYAGGGEGEKSQTSNPHGRRPAAGVQDGPPAGPVPGKEGRAQL